MDPVLTNLYNQTKCKEIENLSTDQILDKISYIQEHQFDKLEKFYNVDLNGTNEVKKFEYILPSDELDRIFSEINEELTEMANNYEEGLYRSVFEGLENATKAFTMPITIYKATVDNIKKVFKKKGKL